MSKEHPTESQIRWRAKQKAKKPATPPMSAEEKAYKAGWADGYYAGGEHDCRMFEPSAAEDWKDYKERKR